MKTTINRRKARFYYVLEGNLKRLLIQDLLAWKYEGDRQPILEHKMEAVAYSDTLNLVGKRSSWGKKPAQNQGMGLASMIYSCGGFSSAATINVNEDGSVIVLTGATDIELAGGGLPATGKLVTTLHACAFTGGPHPAGSTNVKASL